MTVNEIINNCKKALKANSLNVMDRKIKKINQLVPLKQIYYLQRNDSNSYYNLLGIDPLKELS